MLYSFSFLFLITTGTWHCSRKTTWEALWEEARVTGQVWTFPRTALTHSRVKKDPATTELRWSICSRESNHCSSLPVGHLNLDAQGSLGWHGQCLVAAGSTRAKETPARSEPPCPECWCSHTINSLHVLPCLGIFTLEAPHRKSQPPVPS